MFGGVIVVRAAEIAMLEWALADKMQARVGVGGRMVRSLPHRMDGRRGPIC